VPRKPCCYTGAATARRASGLLTAASAEATPSMHRLGRPKRANGSVVQVLDAQCGARRASRRRYGSPHRRAEQAVLGGWVERQRTGWRCAGSRRSVPLAPCTSGRRQTDAKRVARGCRRGLPVQGLELRNAVMFRIVVERIDPETINLPRSSTLGGAAVDGGDPVTDAGITSGTIPGPRGRPIIPKAVQIAR